MENQNREFNLTAAGNSKPRIDDLAQRMMTKGIMAVVFSSVWFIGFLGIIFGYQTLKLEREFIALEGRTYNCAKIGSICGKVGRILGIVDTILLGLLLTFIIIAIIAGLLFGVSSTAIHY